MPAKRSFDADLAALDALRDADPETAPAPLRKALSHRSNLIVAKAAKLVAHHALRSLEADLLASFDRFFNEPVKSDPQCWAKIALAKTLAGFELQEAEPFLRGLRHHQLEAVWGGRSDTAGPLRSTCALALVQCRSLSSMNVLAHLTPLFADKEDPVRLDAVRAVEQVGTDAAVLLLRLRAEIGKEEPEILGACIAGVLRIEGPSRIPWTAKFLPPAHGPDDLAAEVALAVGETRTEAAIDLLLSTADSSRLDHAFLETLYLALALTRQERALAHLLRLIRDDSREALAALCRSSPPQAIRDQLIALGHTCP